jgi:hypothetical protein
VCGQTNVTPSLELIGNPFTEKPAYARNVWDMQFFEGKLYLGHGNSSNEAPNPNAGPIPVWTLDVASKTFSHDFTVDEEQIDRFRIFDDKLYIPGHDPKEGWELGNYYVLEPDGWQKHRVIPHGIHIYDLLRFKGQWFAALGTNGVQPSVLVSDDLQTWRPVTSVAQRAHELFEFQGTLYAMHWAYTDNDPGSSGLYAYNGELFLKVGIPGKRLFPNAPADSLLRMTHLTTFANQLVYIGAEFQNDHQSDPLENGLYVAPRLNQARQIVLPLENAKPYDILQQDNTLFVLVSKKEESGYINAVYQTQDLTAWTELFRFSSETFARSFETVDGDFYFGLGSNPDTVSEAAGTILKVSRNNYP